MFKMIKLFFKYRNEMKELIPVIQFLLDARKDGISYKEQKQLRGMLLGKLEKILGKKSPDHKNHWEL